MKGELWMKKEKDINKKEETLEEAEILEDQEFEGIDEEQIVSLEGFLEELQSSNKKLEDERVRLENEANAYKDKLLRLSAEYDNYRKRTIKEKEGIYTDACEDVLKTMFPVLDNLERAAAVDGSIEDIKKGIELTIRQFKDSLEKLLVEEVSISEGFDPNLHNAVMHVEDSNFGEKEIVEVFQKGYKKGDRVLRHSMVKVAN